MDRFEAARAKYLAFLDKSKQKEDEADHDVVGSSVAAVSPGEGDEEGVPVVQGCALPPQENGVRKNKARIVWSSEKKRRAMTVYVMCSRRKLKNGEFLEVRQSDAIADALKILTQVCLVMLNFDL